MRQSIILLSSFDKMKILIVDGFLFASVLTVILDKAKGLKNTSPDHIGTRIYRGKPADVGQFPWHVVIYDSNFSEYGRCGGSLISDQWVLTAAHCIRRFPDYTVKLGGITQDLDEEGTTIVYSNKTILHPKYNAKGMLKDIGLIKLPDPVTLSDRIQPVKLPNSEDFLCGGQTTTVSGTGVPGTSGPLAGRRLLYVNLTTITRKECGKYYGEVTTDYICARGEHKGNICAGDSGGPLVTYDEDDVATLVGVAGFTHFSGCQSGAPSGYARVTAYLDWISEETGIEV